MFRVMVIAWRRGYGATSQIVECADQDDVLALGQRIELRNREPETKTEWESFVLDQKGGRQPS